MIENVQKKPVKVQCLVIIKGIPFEKCSSITNNLFKISKNFLTLRVMDSVGGFEFVANIC